MVIVTLPVLDIVTNKYGDQAEEVVDREFNIFSLVTYKAIDEGHIAATFGNEFWVIPLSREKFDAIVKVSP